MSAGAAVLALEIYDRADERCEHGAGPDSSAYPCDECVVAEIAATLAVSPVQHVCTKCGYVAATQYGDAQAAQTRALETHVFMLANCLSFWLDWARARGAITGAGDELLTNARAALTGAPRETPDVS